MRKFLLMLDTDKMDVTLPTSGQIAVIVMENNPGVRFVETHSGALLAVECENKPRKIEGCKWVKEE